MAEWYYKREETTFGPYSEEVMAELIDNGKVTFVTMVRNEDTKNEGREWSYAYETPLASYFSGEFPTEDMPDRPVTEMPPASPEPDETPPAEAMPEPPEPAELTTPPEAATAPPPQSEPEEKTSPEAAGPKTERRISPLLIVILLALFATGLIIGAVSRYLTR